MDKYDSLGIVGEGSYGIVSKARHRPTCRIVAIKKFIESEEDKNVRKIALREIRALKKLKHDNLVALLEVFRRKKRLYLVFEFVDRTVLDELERSPNGLTESFTGKIIYQVLKAINYMHSICFLHRDIKPENILVSKNGVVKICDFGFARPITREANNLANSSLKEIIKANSNNDENQNSENLTKNDSNKTMPSISENNKCTDYVATRWYRAPELLIGELNYGTGVDIWAIGCLAAELSNSLPLFPGKSDLDQLYLIMTCCGDLCERHKMVFSKSSSFKKLLKSLPKYKIGSIPIERSLKSASMDIIELIKLCLKMEPADRWTCKKLIERASIFNKPVFINKHLPEILSKTENESNKKQVNISATRQSQSKTTQRQSTQSQNSGIIKPKNTYYNTSNNKFCKQQTNLALYMDKEIKPNYPHANTKSQSLTTSKTDNRSSYHDQFSKSLTPSRMSRFVNEENNTNNNLIPKSLQKNPTGIKILPGNSSLNSPSSKTSITQGAFGKTASSLGFYSDTPLNNESKLTTFQPNLSSTFKNNQYNCHSVQFPKISSKRKKVNGVGKMLNSDRKFKRKGTSSGELPMI